MSALRRARFAPPGLHPSPVCAAAAAVLALAACGTRPAPENTPASTGSASVPPPAPPTVPAADAMPVSRGGADLVGTSFAGLLPERWIGAPVALSGADAPRATWIRFWTDTCPYCASSLPEIERLRERYATAGLATVGVYHPKPPQAVTDDHVRAAAERLGYRGPIAVDPEWRALRAMWLDAHERSATSVSFLVDARGEVRFVHPGPEYDDADLVDIERAVTSLLAE